jgi:hypothetical protein
MGVQAEHIIPKMRNKLATITPAELLPLAHSLSLPPQLKKMLVDDRVSGKEKRERERASICIVM